MAKAPPTQPSFLRSIQFCAMARIHFLALILINVHIEALILSSLTRTQEKWTAQTRFSIHSSTSNASLFCPRNPIYEEEIEEVGPPFSIHFNRRNLIQILTLTTIALPSSADARNLPASNGADISQAGTIQALVPIVKLRDSIQVLKDTVDQRPLSEATRAQVRSLSASLPSTEQEFKRLFDAYSDPISYKQKFLDQNAFLVYYTQGFDGPGRPSIETATAGEERQMAQFGARNDAWVAFDNVLVEAKLYVQGDDDNDLGLYLTRALQAVDTYLKLAPLKDAKQAMCLQ